MESHIHSIKEVVALQSWLSLDNYFILPLETNDQEI